MRGTPANDAIEVLIHLARQGEIDPWDVDVIDVIDRFLREIGVTDNLNSSSQPDLPKSGQAFLWASMLVLLKADTLQSLEEADEEDLEVEEAEPLDEGDKERSLPVRLERHIRRRASAPAKRKRRVTLKELIAQIRAIATELETAPASKRSRRSSRREVARAIAGLAHNENLTEVAAQLEHFLTVDFPRLAQGQTSVDLDQLVQWWTKAIIEMDSSSEQLPDKVGVFWALLLLCAQSKVELFQQEFYQDLTIIPLCAVNSK